MPVSSQTVGVSGPWVDFVVDARVLMAYAAGLDDDLECYLDTRRPGGIVAHPLFPVSFEWPVLLGVHRFPENESLAAAERLRGVHATHDLLIHRPIRDGDRLETRATIAGVERRPPGAFQVIRFDTHDAAGRAVCTTWYGTIFRGVAVEGPDRPATDRPPAVPATAPAARSESLAIGSTAAHVYSECARIWNPIHTDAAVAAQAGLPGIILHGTATLAMAVSAIVRGEAGADPTRVRRVSARFGAMVPIPSQIAVRIGKPDRTPGGVACPFVVGNAAGELALRDGLVILDGGANPA